MRTHGLAALLVATAMVAGACSADVSVTPTPSATPSPSPTTTPSTPPSTGTTCDPATALTTIDASVAVARLVPVASWSPDVTANGFAERTTTAGEFARRLGLDCGFLAGERIGEADERLVIAAWTGPRLAWVVQTTETPSTPYVREATVDVNIDEVEGEYLDDERSAWAGTLDNGETFVVGHVDLNLGAAAKGWVAEEPPPDGAITLSSERHAIAALDAAGMREVDIAEPPELGSEEGHVQFVSPTGQISVADVAPTGWFDPLQARYYTGPTRYETLSGVQVRVTEPNPDDNLGFAIAVEIGFACDDFVWILQPPLNGDADQLLASATAILGTQECRAG